MRRECFMRVRLLISIILSVILLTACASKGEYQIYDVRIYKDTPAWMLAKAVNKENTSKIESLILENPELLNYQDPRYGATLLYWSVGKDYYESAKKLLDLGADPNIKTTYLIETALFQASGYLWHDSSLDQDPKFVKLLLENGADPNISFGGYSDKEKNSVTAIGETPLMASINTGIEKTKALIDGECDINQKDKYGKTAATRSLLNEDYIKYAYLLIVVNKAHVNEPVYSRIKFEQGIKESYYPVRMLRNLLFELDSDEYKMKMEIVKEFQRQDQDYWSTEITDEQMKRIKQLYPDTWEEYINKY
ncbi:MAG: ankyrin repeat domain-containing protein [Clostridiales bacterium]|nr:ankyrin repeat domain-containing protein [Clostridiales bacterium]